MKYKTVSKKNNNFWLDAIRLSFLGILFIAPLIRGMFFEEHYIPLTILTSLLTLSFLWYMRNTLTFDLLDLIALFLCLSYAISFIVSVHARNALLGFIKYTLYFCSFILAGKLFKNEKNKKQLLWILLSSISVSTIITFLTHAQVINYPGAIWSGRFTSTLQYPNSYAAVLVALVPVLLLYYSRVEKSTISSALISVLFLNITAFYAALSRGALIFYIPTLLLTLFIIPRSQLLSIMIKIILLNALAILVANYVIKHPGLYSLLITIGGLILVNIVNLFLNRIKFKINRTSLIISAVLLIVISILAINITDASVANSLKRLTDINLRTQSASERFTFYYDALRIFKDNWLIGIGAGGWEAVYKTVQGHLYDSTEVHSSIFQSLIEVGLVGTLLFLALVAIIVTMVFIRVIQKQLDDLDKVIFLAVIVIFAHSIIDFDLSLPAISMYLFVLLGVLKVDQYYAIGSKIWSKVLFGAITLVVAGIFILSAGIGVGHSLTGDAKNAFKEGKSLTVRQVDKYEKNIQRAISLDPLNADYYTLLGQIKVNKASSLHNDVEAEEGINYLNKAIDLEPYNYRRYLVKANNLIQLNRRAEAIASFEKIIQIMPFQHTGYEYAARNYTTLGIETGQKAYLEKTIDTYQRAAEQMTKIDPNRLRLWHYEHLDQSSALNYHTGVAYFLLGEIEKGLNHLKAALKTASSESFKSDILAWMYVGQEKLNLTPRVNVDSSKVKEVEKVIDDFNIKVTGR